jgi:hypothetical protein
MDAKVFYQEKGVWHVNASPTMRSLGVVLENGDKSLRIEPEEGSNLDGVATGPYRSIEEVMDAIAAYLGGKCNSVWRRRY